MADPNSRSRLIAALIVLSLPRAFDQFLPRRGPESALDILKRRYAVGELTREQ